MRAAGLNPKYQIIDNKASAKYKAAIIAKKAIQFWEDHFVAVLSGASSTFPLRIW